MSLREAERENPVETFCDKIFWRRAERQKTFAANQPLADIGCATIVDAGALSKNYALYVHNKSASIHCVAKCDS